MPTRKHPLVKPDTPSLKRQLEKKGKALQRELEIAERRTQALMLRKEGHDYAEIGRRVGVSGVTARQYVLDELVQRREDGGEDIESVRDLELHRTDTMLSIAWPKMLAGDKMAMAMCLQILERRSSYLGLDAPKRTEFIGAVATLTTDEAKTLTDEDLKKKALAITQKLLGGS